MKDNVNIIFVLKFQTYKGNTACDKFFLKTRVKSIKFTRKKTTIIRRFVKSIKQLFFDNSKETTKISWYTAYAIEEQEHKFEDILRLSFFWMMY